MCVEPPLPLTPLAIFSFLLPASLQLESLEPLCRSKFLSVSGKPGGVTPPPVNPLSGFFFPSSGKTNPVGSKWAFGKSFFPNPGLGVPARRGGGDKMETISGAAQGR